MRAKYLINLPGPALALRLNVIDPNWIPVALNWSVLGPIQRSYVREEQWA